jgi:hypothetical protein
MELTKGQGNAIIATGGILLVGVITLVIVKRVRANKIYTSINKILDADPNSAANQSKAAAAAAATQKALIAAAAQALSPVWYKTSAKEITSGSSKMLANSSGILMTRNTAQTIADSLYSDYNLLLPNNIGDVLKQIAEAGSKTKMSYVADVFQQKYGTMLIDFFNNKLLATTDPTQVANAQEVFPALQALPN